MHATAHTDWTGLATFVAAFGAAIVSIIGALKAHGADSKVAQVQRDIILPSDPTRPIGAAVDDSRQVQTALVNEYQDLRTHNPALDRRMSAETDRRQAAAEATPTTPTVNDPLTPEGGGAK